MRTTGIIFFCLIFLHVNATAQSVTASFQQGVNGYTGCKSVNISDLSLGLPGQFGDNGTSFGDGYNDWSIGLLHGHSSFGYDISPLLLFEDLDIPANANVISANLTVYLIVYDPGAKVTGKYLNRSWYTGLIDTIGGTTNTRIGWRYTDKATNDSWGALGATMEGTDLVAGTQFVIPEGGGTIPATGEQVFTVQLDTEIIQQWISTPVMNYGVKLQADVSNIHVGYVQPQRSTSADKHPKLEITYSPATNINEEEAVPLLFNLAQNYPNPFNPMTTISFTIEQSVFVTLTVYNVVGNEVASLISKNLPAGTHSATWDASSMASGIYFYRLQAGSNSSVKIMTLMQ